MTVKATRPRSHSSPTRESTSVAVSAAAGGGCRADTGRESSRTFDEDPRERPKRTDRSVPGVPWTVIGTPNAFRVASTTGPGPVSVPVIVTGPLPLSPKRTFHLPGAAEPLRLNVFPVGFVLRRDRPTYPDDRSVDCPLSSSHSRRPPRAMAKHSPAEMASVMQLMSAAYRTALYWSQPTAVAMGDGDATDSFAVAGVAMPRLATNPAAARGKSQ